MLKDVDLSMYGIYNSAEQELVFRFLESRGITTPQEVENIFNPSIEDAHNIMSATGAKAWLAILFSVQNTNIVIVGDYDADGVMASTVAYQGLKLLGIGHKISQYVPIREDGYGLSSTSVDKLLKEYPDTETIITVDNGVVAYEGVSYAKDRGLTVLVTDHHLGKDEDTVADATVDINRPGDGYPFKGLSGTAVIWKLLQAYARTVANPEVNRQIDNLVDYVGISTITDIMPVLDENRYYVKQALNSMNKRLRTQWQVLFTALKKHAEDNGKHAYIDNLNEEFIGFTLGPMLNAVGRVTGSPEIAYDFFRTTDLVTMMNDAKSLIEINERRKDEVAKFADMASDLYDGKQPESIVVALPVKIGYAGLIASNLNERFDRPVIVLSGRQGTIHGSARSPMWFNIVEAMQTMFDEGLIGQFGGHAGAAGLEMDSSNVDIVQERLDELVAEELEEIASTGKVVEKTKPDLSLHLETNFAARETIATDFGLSGNDDLVEVADIFDKMRPFGHAFSEPLVKVSDVDFESAFRMGSEKQHAKAKLGNLAILAWNLDKSHENIESVLGTLGINEFRGNVTPQIMVKKFI